MRRIDVLLYVLLLKFVKIGLPLFFTFCTVVCIWLNKFGFAMTCSLAALLIFVLMHHAEIVLQRRAQIKSAEKPWEIGVVLMMMVIAGYSLFKGSLMRLADNRHDALRSLADAPTWAIWVVCGILIVLGMLLQLRNRKHTPT